MLIDLLVFPYFFFANYFLIRVCFKMTNLYYRNEMVLSKIGRSVVYYYFVIVVVGQFLGATGVLMPSVYAMIIYLICFLGNVWTNANLKNRPDRFRLIWKRKDVELIWFFVWTLVIAVFFTVKNGLLRFPGDWDTLVYHLPYVDQWLLSNNLYSRNSWMWSNPGNNEVFTLWIVGLFSGDFLFSLTNLPSLVFLFWGIIEVCHGLRFKYVFWGPVAVVVVVNYVAVYQLQTTMNDTTVAGLFVCGIGLALKYLDKGRSKDMTSLVIVVGLLAGVKYFALGYACLIIFICGLEIVIRKQGCKNGFKWFHFILLLSGGAFWYLRNYFITGYPFYPLGAALSGESITEFYPDVFGSTFLGNNLGLVLPLFLKAVLDMGGPIAHFAVFNFMPSVFVIVFFGLFGPSKTRKWRARIFLCSLVGAFVLFICTPFAVESEPGSLNQLIWEFGPCRYGYGFISLCIVALFYSCSIVEKKLLRYYLKKSQVVAFGAGFLCWLVKYGVVASCLYQLCVITARIDNSIVELALHVVVALEIVFVYYLYLPYFSNMGWIAPALKRCMFAVFWMSVGLVSYAWHSQFAEYYDRTYTSGVVAFLKRSEFSGKKIGVFEERMYPLFGCARENIVMQIPPSRGYVWLDKNLKSLGFNYVLIKKHGKDSYKNWNHLNEYFDGGEKTALIKRFDNGYLLYCVKNGDE